MIDIKSLKHSEKSGKSSSIIVVSEGERIGDNVFKFSSYIEENFPIMKLESLF